MHEVSIAQGMLDIAFDELAKHNCSRLTKLTVRIGALSGVVCESLSLAFTTLLQDTEHSEAVLEIERVPLKLHCGNCGHDFMGESLIGELSSCPQCGETFGHSVLSGKELEITWLEGL